MAMMNSLSANTEQSTGDARCGGVASDIGKSRKTWHSRQTDQDSYTPPGIVSPPQPFCWLISAHLSPGK
ncbi:hypothetical protein BaRGS_00002444 [Batillaria attramentaria]|uniref:Uncharacterized protein n=1 Tax=Batillaria attramentaria TaxID=370345 RepID=A0ABD0M3X0_9CAEN